MEAESQHSWRIRVQAKAKSFNFRLHAISNIPHAFTLRPHRLSFLLKLRRFLLIRVNSESSAYVPAQSRTTLKSKFFISLKKFNLKRILNRVLQTLKRSKHTNREAKILSNRSQRQRLVHQVTKPCSCIFFYSFIKFIIADFLFQELFVLCSLLVGVIGFLAQWFWSKDRNGLVIMYSLAILVCFAILLLKKYRASKSSIKLLEILLVATMALASLSMIGLNNVCAMAKYVWDWN